MTSNKDENKIMARIRSSFINRKTFSSVKSLDTRYNDNPEHVSRHYMSARLKTVQYGNELAKQVS